MSVPTAKTAYVEEVVEGLPAGAVTQRESFRDQWAVTVRRDALAEVMEALRDRWGFRYLIDVTAVDFHPRNPRFQVVYHLWCHERNALLRVKTWVEGDPPSVPSMTALWSTANWHERECFDLFGILFDGHPDLRRILLPQSWEGHPLRKDYPTEGPDWDVD